MAKVQPSVPSNLSISTRLLSNKKLKGRLLVVIIILISFGAPFVLALSNLLAIMPTPFSVLFRVIIFFISVFLIFGSITRFRKTTIPAYFLLMFWVIYTIRLIYDIEVLGISFGNQPSIFVYSFGIGNAFIPMIAIVFNVKFIKINELIIAQFYFLLATAFLICISLINQYGFSLSIFTYRLDLELETTEGSLIILNAITLSLVGATLGILSIAQILLKKIKGIPLILSIIGLIIGLFTLLLGASRGPTLTFILTFIFVFYIFVKKNIFKRKNIINKIKVGLALFVLAGILIPLAYLNRETLSENIMIVSRLETFFSESISNKNDTRNILFRDAWDQFLSNPILGNHYIEMNSGHYPHNVYVEVLMATGVVGAIFYYIPLFWIGVNLIQIMRKKCFQIVVLYLVLMVYLLLQFTSGNLFLNNIWAFFILLLALPKRQWIE